MKKIFDVKGMHCKSCEMLIKDSLEEASGVKGADVSHIKGTVKVDFDDSKISEDKIRQIIKENGYEVLK